MRANIEWRYSGTPDGFFGTGATPAERTLVWVFGLLGAAVLGWHWGVASLPWMWWHYVIAALFALDVLGGVVANSLNSCKRFYHSPLQPMETGFTALAKNHLAFAAFHVHPLLVGLIFGPLNWVYGLFGYALLVASTALVLRLPLYLHRPAAAGFVLLALLLNFYAIPPITGFEWLIPALFLKIVYGHSVREEPYRE